MSQAASSLTLIAEPAVKIIAGEDHRHGLGMDGTDHLIGLARQEGHERPALARSPQASESEQLLVILLHAEPDLAFPLGLGVRLSGPLSELCDRHDAAPLDVTQR